MTEPIRLTTPLTDEMLDPLRCGDLVLITGTLYAARDAAHLRLRELDERGEPWPFPTQGAIIYYVGPTPTRPGMASGSAGPTTASRMDKLTPMVLEHGVKGLIGKGNRGKDLWPEFRKHHAVYFAAIGGAGAVAAQRIRSSEVIAFSELGPEAIRAMEVEDFPSLVINDVTGDDFYSHAASRWRKRHSLKSSQH